jgi:2-hydroxychromene-2-carboxylate isomerase
MATPIVFYSDFSSPHTYLAIQPIEEVAARHGREIDWRPMSLFHVWQAIEHNPIGRPKAKARYVRKDFQRAARMAGVRFTMPDKFPVDAVLARQAFYRVNALDPGLAVRFAHAVFERYWGEGKDISLASQIAESTTAIGIDEDELRQAEGDNAAKQAAIRMSDQAVADGVFGTPFFIVDGETFWGHDRVAHLDWWLSREGE